MARRKQSSDPKQEHQHSDDQLILFSPTKAIAKKSAPWTSHAAAESVNLPKRCKLVRELHEKYGPMTDEEMNDAARKEGHTLYNTGLAPARCMMTPPNGAGMVDSGESRLGRSGKWHIVWKIDETATPYVEKKKKADAA